MEFISITNDPKVAQLFEKSGIHDIMVDLEIIGKQERQKGLNTVISAHSVEDISVVKSSLSTSKCLVRINPVYEGTNNEIEEAIKAKADILMLPMFKTAEEVAFFVESVGTRAEKYLLLETAQALVRVDDILEVNGIDAIHIGLNDLSISMGLNFLYEPLIGGIIEYLAKKIISRKIKFGFGGVSRLDVGRLILSEHYRLGSEMVILNRSFRNYMDKYDEIIKTVDLKKEVDRIMNYLKELEGYTPKELDKNRISLIAEIKDQISRQTNK